MWDYNGKHFSFYHFSVTWNFPIGQWQEQDSDTGCPSKLPGKDKPEFPYRGYEAGEIF